MRACCLLVLCAGLALAQDKAAKDELVKLQGDWYLAELEFQGKKLSGMELTDGGGKLVVKDNKIETSVLSQGVAVSFPFVKVGEKQEPLRPVLKQIRTDRDQVKITDEKPVALTFKLDPTAKPGHIDVAMEGVEVQGIYELKGDVLKVCAGEPNSGRPKEFKAGKTAVVTFVRAKELKARAEARKQPIQDELKKLEGTWTVVEGRYDNAALSEKDLKDFQLVFKGDELTWKEAGQSETLRVLLDPAALPERAIDLAAPQGGKALPVRGIYKLDGERLILRLPWNHKLYRVESFDPKGKGGFPDAQAAYLVLKKAAP